MAALHVPINVREMDISWRRLAAAIVIAPLCTPLVVGTVTVAFEPDRHGLLGALLVSLYALVFAYAATIVVGLPVFVVIRRLGRLSAVSAVLVGLGASVIVMALLRTWLRPGFESVLGLVASVGACLLAGGLSAYFFYRIAVGAQVRTPPSN